MVRKPKAVKETSAMHQDKADSPLKYPLKLAKKWKTSAEPAPENLSRIQEMNRKLILDAALDVFSTYGFRGSTIDQIALKSGMSKPNLLYYFRRKEDIYSTVLQQTMEEWLASMQAIDSQASRWKNLVRISVTRLKWRSAILPHRACLPMKLCMVHRRSARFCKRICAGWWMRKLR